MESEYETVVATVEDQVLTVEVDRPESRNAVNLSLLDELSDVLSDAEGREDVQAVVLTGAGEGIFIAGGDISEFIDADGDWWMQEFHPRVKQLEDSMEGNSLPIIAAVDGVALGGGTEIAMMCDMIVASEEAEFGTPEITLGLIPGAGGTQRLARLVGYLKAKEIVMTGRRVPADEAREIGLANRVVPADDFDNEVYELAEQLAEGPSLAQHYAKISINQARQGLEDGRDLERVLTRTLFDSEDKDEGVDAFLNKRSADFNK